MRAPLSGVLLDSRREYMKCKGKITMHFPCSLVAVALSLLLVVSCPLQAREISVGLVPY